MKFDERISRISSIWLKDNRRSSALTRLLRLLFLEKRRILFKAFIESQFKYWCFTEDKQTKNLSDLLALRIVYNHYVSLFQDLLNKDNSFTNYHKNILPLTAEVLQNLK